MDKEKTNIGYERWIAILIVCAATIATFSPILTHGFSDWDDGKFISAVWKPSLERAWAVIADFDLSHSKTSYYSPLAILSLMLDQALILPLNEPQAWISKLGNLALHTLNTVLLFLLLHRLGLSRFQCLVGSLVFGLHPLQVGAVAWIAERKTILCGLFYLLSMLAYLRRLDSSRIGPLFASLIFILLALLSKPAAVTIPIVLLAYRFIIHKNEPFRSTEIAFFIVSIAMVAGWGIFTLHTELTYRGILPPLIYRPLIVSSAILFYLYKFLIPLNLAPIYPKWEIIQSPGLFAIPLVLVTIAGIAIIYFRHRIHRLILFGVVFFLVNLAPVSGLAPFGYMQFSYVADHFMYFPIIGLAIIVSVLVGALFSWAALDDSKALRTMALIAVYGWLGALAIASVNQTQVWKTPASVWEATLEVNPKAMPAIHNYAQVYIDSKEYDKALVLLARARELAPRFFKVYRSMGWVYFLKGEYDKALIYFNKSAKINPGDAMSHKLAANAMERLKGYESAVARLKEGLEQNPESALLICELGRLRLRTGKVDAAMARFTEAIQLEPQYAPSYIYRAEAFLDRQDYKAALRDAESALARVNSAKAYNMLGVASINLGMPRKALAGFLKAYEINPRSPGVVDNVANVIMDLGNYSVAHDFCKKNQGRLHPCSETTMRRINERLGAVSTSSRLEGPAGDR